MTESSADLYASRRERTLAAMGEDAVLVLPAAAEVIAGRDTELRYRPDTDLYYLSGYTEPEAVLVLAPGAEAPYTLFVRPRDPERELWTGRRGGVDAARERFGADAAYPIGELAARLPDLLAGRSTIYARLGGGGRVLEAILTDTLVRGRSARQRTGRGARTLKDPGALLDEPRLIKDAREIALLREATRVSAEALLECAAAVRDGVGEWEVQAAFEYAVRRRGAEGPSFETIVASGENATVLHYIANERRMQAGELLLVDAGASYSLYAGDITRTFPVSGHFSTEQRAMYEVVRMAHDAAIAAVRPGAPADAVHHIAVRSLVEGLVDMGILQGEVDALVQEENRWKPFYPHNTSHWLGLDVHDVGDYARGGASRPLEPGMVLTVEPGLYFPAGAAGVPAALQGTGIRLEDDVLVTESGADVLTGSLPILPDAVESLIGG